VFYEKLARLSNVTHPSTAEVARLLGRRQSVLRTKDLEDGGLNRVAVRRLCDRKVLHRVGRGLYTLEGSAPTESRTVVEAIVRVPAGVLCLLSALRFHEMTTQSPHEVWLALPTRAWKPVVEWPPIRVMRFSPKTLSFGTKEHRLEGVLVRVTTPAKTVADCFKFRNKIGKDVAIEALRDYRRERRGSIDALLQAADVDRVRRVILPYLEALS
jgi:predicted transcriptional regulator of viral defense system